MYREYSPNQSYLLPPSPRDWLSEGHLAWFISDTVDQLDIDALEVEYRKAGKGELPYSPRMMLKVLFYAYASGTFSSRKIARGVEEIVPLRVLAAEQRPSHRTIRRFRDRHRKHFEILFVQLVQIASEAGLVSMGSIAIDGTKIHANASKHKAMSYDRMRQEESRLRKEIHELTRSAKKQDKVEDAKYGPDFRGDELPEEIARRKTRLDAIQKARKRLEARKQAEAEAEAASGEQRTDDPDDSEPPAPPPKLPPVEPKATDQENFTDPESRIMRGSSGGFEQAYNAQAAVDSANRLIIANDVTQCASDARQLVPMIDQVVSNTGKQPTNVLADAGYRSEENFVAVEERKIAAFVSLGREGKTVPAPGKPATQRMLRSLRTKRGRRIYKTRKHIVEPVFGWAKQALGFRQFLLRGLEKVQAEWDLVCIALNLRTMARRIEWK